MRIPARWPRTATPLTWLILVLLPLATLTGLFVSGFYRDTAWMVPQARGQDLVSLLAIEPLLIAALLSFRRRPIAAMLIWMGALGYVLYTYAMYSYTAYFNALFLVYIGLFSASLFALIDLLTHVDLTQVRASIRPALPVKLIALACALVGAFFLVTWLGQIVPATLQGRVPESILLAKTPTSAVHVQDLAVVLPLYFLTAVWLWRRQAWGFVLAPVMLILADVMLLAILVMGAFSAQAGIPGALDMAPVFAVLLLASLTLTGLYFANLRPAGSGDDVPAPQTARRAPGTIEDARRKVGV
ncbi:MAG TPA: hypothetical protein VF807_02370 [Ktedonobacterales bacterium]